jgi:hypothetical protein
MKTTRKGATPRSDLGVIVTLSPRDYDAVLFDLDGVLTRTASVHAAAWKKLFDAFLERRAAERREPFVPFDIDADYRRHVDGKPRYDGVAAFLAVEPLEHVSSVNSNPPRGADDHDANSSNRDPDSTGGGRQRHRLHDHRPRARLERDGQCRSS